MSGKTIMIYVLVAVLIALAFWLGLRLQPPSSARHEVTANPECGERGCTEGEK